VATVVAVSVLKRKKEYVLVEYLLTSKAIQLVMHSAQRCFVYDSATVGKKVKEVDLYSAFIEVPYTRGAQVRITQCYLQITPCLPLPRKHSPDGASPD